MEFEKNDNIEEQNIDTEIQAGKLILVIDDIHYIVKSIVNVLKEAGYNVIFAMSGAETKEILRKYSPDLITVDQKLPDTTGMKLVNEITKLCVNKIPKIIFISANYDKEEIQSILKHDNISNYLLKPFKKQKLIEVIKELIGEP